MEGCILCTQSELQACIGDTDKPRVIKTNMAMRLKMASFYVASLWRYYRLIVWEGCDKLEGCDELKGTGGDPLLPGKAGELRAHSESRVIGPDCADTDEPGEVKTNMAKRMKSQDYLTYWMYTWRGAFTVHRLSYRPAGSLWRAARAPHGIFQD